jgi:hypothetical protein
MRWSARVSLLAAMLAAALWSPPRSAAEDDAPTAPQVTDQQRQRAASHAQRIATALGQTAMDGGLGAGPKTPKAGKRVVATHQSARQALDGSAPPAVLGDIAMPPQGVLEKYVYPYLFKSSKSAQVFEWLSHRGDDADERSIREAYDYYRLHTTAGKALSDSMRPSSDESDATSGRANFADTGQALAVTIPLLGIGARTQGQQWSVTLNESERDAPVEARALLMGHEIGVHASDTTDGFLSNPGSQIPSELRALVMDAKNYLEIRAALEERGDTARLAMLRQDAAWQQADLKARIVLGIPVGSEDYPDSKGEVAKDADFAGQKQRLLDDAAAVAQAYIASKYAGSGETGMQNLNLKDGSAVGQYNLATESLIADIRRGSYPFMSHGL